MSSAKAEDQEAPFTLVGRKSRRTAANKASGSQSNRVAHKASTSNGFTYSAKSTRDKSETTLEHAETRVNLFCDFLRPASLKEGNAAASYSSKLQTTLEQVWPESSNVDHEKARLIPEIIVCLGLGSPTTSRSAQIQLALLVIIREYLSHIKPPDSNGSADALPRCVAFDPIFTPDDTTLLTKFGILCVEPKGAIDTIENHYTSIDRPTLLYMPHCDRSLYEDVLARNTPTTVDELSKTLEATTLNGAPQNSALSNITLLANPLNKYLDNMPRSEYACIPTLSRLAPQMHSVALPNWSPTKSQQVGQMGQLWDTIALNEIAFQWL